MERLENKTIQLQYFIMIFGNSADSGNSDRDIASNQQNLVTTKKTK